VADENFSPDKIRQLFTTGLKDRIAGDEARKPCYAGSLKSGKTGSDYTDEKRNEIAMKSVAEIVRESERDRELITFL
jgi:hypothetical protein